MYSRIWNKIKLNSIRKTQKLSKSSKEKSENYKTRTEQVQKMKNSKITVNHRINTRIKMLIGT